MPVVLRFLVFTKFTIMKNKSWLKTFLLAWPSGRPMACLCSGPLEYPCGVGGGIIPILQLGTLNPERVTKQARLRIWIHIWGARESPVIHSSRRIELCCSGNIWGPLTKTWVPHLRGILLSGNKTQGGVTRRMEVKQLHSCCMKNSGEKVRRFRPAGAFLAYIPALASLLVAAFPSWPPLCTQVWGPPLTHHSLQPQESVQIWWCHWLGGAPGCSRVVLRIHDTLPGFTGPCMSHSAYLSAASAVPRHVLCSSQTDWFLPGSQCTCSPLWAFACPFSSPLSDLPISLIPPGTPGVPDADPFFRPQTSALDYLRRPLVCI